MATADNVAKGGQASFIGCFASKESERAAHFSEGSKHELVLLLCIREDSNSKLLPNGGFCVSYSIFHLIFCLNGSFHTIAFMSHFTSLVLSLPV